MAALPTPHTTTDMLLVAVHEQLVGLRQDIADQRAVRGGERTPKTEEPTGQVELTEPKPAKAPRKTTTR